MIDRVTIRRFKRFVDVAFDLRGDHVVLAGPNNTGKTTVLQAIAAWDLAFRRFKEHGDFHRHGGAYSKVAVSRPTFSAVPLRSFDLLWQDRRTTAPIEIEIRASTGWSVAMEIASDTSEQVFVRPARTADGDVLRDVDLPAVFVPAMTGLSTQEALYAQRETVDALLGQARPGEVLRNLLVEAYRSEQAWSALTSAIRRLFGYTLIPPAVGAYITAEFQARPAGPRFDIAGAGSGFQQVLMLLTFLHTRPGAVLLLDEPDAHLHIILQDAIFSELRAVAAANGSQLVIATHSEVIINAVPPENLYLVLDQPRRIVDAEEQRQLARSLSRLPNADLMAARVAPGVLYVEDYTDLDILREFARVLGHRAFELLEADPFWKPVHWQPRPDGKGIKAREHYESLALVRPDLPALELTDKDAGPGGGEAEITGHGFQRLRWRRYEIESYLVHPAALARFVEQEVGGGALARPHLDNLEAHLRDTFPPAVLRDPLGDHEFLNVTKARERLLPPALTAAGLPGYPYTRYHRIAAAMHPEEIHPEVVEKLDLLCKAFGR